MKKMFAPLMALCLALSLVLPAFAANEYGLVYDQTGKITEYSAKFIDKYNLAPFDQEYGIELRLHLTSDLGGKTIEDYAKDTYTANNYGNASTGCGLLLVVQAHEDDSGLAFDQYTTYASDELNERMEQKGWTELKDYLDLYLNQETWAGDLAADDENFTMVGASLNSAMQSCVDNAYINLPDTPKGTQAASSTDTAATADYGPYVRDEAGLLTEEQVSTLEEQAKTISNAQKCGVYILTVDDFTADGSDTIRDFSKGYYKDNDLGWGDGRDGEMLVLSMADRDYWLLAYGNHGNAAFTDDNRSTVEDAFLDNFREDDWAGGFADYLTASEELLTEAPSGGDYSYDGDYSGDSMTFFNWKLLGICVIGSCVIALIVCLIFKAQMKSARLKQDASDYVDRGDIRIHAREDRFTHRTESRVRIHDDDDHGGGGGVDSDGFSGGGGKF